LAASLFFIVSLAKYHQKRHFTRTPEPRGNVGQRQASELKFVVQKHDASRLHYDFRLELDGVLKSWAVPKGPSMDPARKSLAVQVEDHPLDYGDFEGTIPKGEYGGGTVMLWDRGTWTPLHDAAAGLAAGKLHFELHGEKLKGEWSLVRMHGKAGGDGKNWLLMKLADRHATDTDILTDAPQSVKTSRSLDEIAGNARNKSAGKKWSRLPTFSPQLAVLAEKPPTGEQWIHEIKFDGYRMLAELRDGNVTLISRNAKDWTAKFPQVVKALEKLKVKSAILDGEIVVLDEQGRSDFQALQNLMKHKRKAEPVYYAFDLPFYEGQDLRDTPLLQRKEQLEKMFRAHNPGPRLNYSEHFHGSGDSIAARACKMGLEGIVSKKIDAPYVSRREPTWVKSKCNQRQEFVVIGFTDPEGKRKGFGALLLGYHDSEGQLVYAGRVGTGFDDRMLVQTHERLKALEQDQPPTAKTPPARERRNAHWVKPSLVAEVRFTGWTEDDLLRHPAFIAFRSDKPASQIVREIPVKAEKIEKAASKVRAKPGKQLPFPPPVLRGRVRVGAIRADGDSSTQPPPQPSPGVPEEGVKTRRAANVPKSAARADTFAGVKLSHPDKVLYPDSNVTKRDVAEFYESAAQWMLPHTADRPLALLRCPNGLAGKCFFQRNWSETMPPAVGKVNVSDGKKSEIHVCVHDLAGIISLAQIGVLEIHTWNCHVDDIEAPDQLIFDLDPGPGVTWKQMIEATRRLKRALEAIRLPAFLKTSGGKGLHVAVPIEPNVPWKSAKAFCQTLAQSLVQESDIFVANMRKDLRGGKVYIDYNRNDRSATAVAPYSTRARAGAAIAMPISWEELGRLKSANHFTVETARRYLDRRKSDPWKSFANSRVDLRKLLGVRSAA
jgi:bifunctional non-homologous end joining protein LigD